jgi:hypothetical protein
MDGIASGGVNGIGANFDSDRINPDKGRAKWPSLKNY